MRNLILIIVLFSACEQGLKGNQPKSTVGNNFKGEFTQDKVKILAEPIYKEQPTLKLNIGESVAIYDSITYSFIGYYDEKPCFNIKDDYSYFIIESSQNNYHKVQNFDSLRVRQINDNGLILSYQTDTLSAYFLYKENGQKFMINTGLKSLPWKVVLSDDANAVIWYDHEKKTPVRYDINKGNIENLPFNGYTIFSIGNILYFENSESDKLTSGHIDLYSFNTITSETEKILDNVYSEGLYVLPNNKLINVLYHKNNKDFAVLFSLENEKFFQLNKSDEIFMSSYTYYNFENDNIVYVKPKGLNKIYRKIPPLEMFDFER